MNIKEYIKSAKNKIAILIDPDDFWESDEKQSEMLSVLKGFPPAIVLVGGSLLSDDTFHDTIDILKSNVNVPVVIFPGDSSQISSKADAILHLSLISGRNPEFLIGQQVRSAFKIHKSGIEVISTGYILIGESETSVAYMSNTTPIPSNKTDIVLATALAGVHIGSDALYLEAGSGAVKEIDSNLIRKVVAVNQGITIVGGGIKDGATAKVMLDAGADLIVIGNGFAKRPNLLKEVL